MAASAFTYRGDRFALHRTGRGEPLLYLHGLDGAAPALPLAERLGSAFDVIVPEQPGFRESDMPDWLTRIDDLAYFQLELLDQLELDRVHLVGHSLGGWVALELAIRFPQRFSTLTLIASAGIHLKGIPKGDLFMRAPDVVLRSMFADPALGDAAVAKVHSSPEEEFAFNKNRNAVARVAWQPPLFNPQLEKWLHRIRLPVHVIWGDTDRLFPIAYAHAFKALLPDARVTILEDCGHYAHIEQPERLQHAISSSFIEAIG
jgi:pimeloyl-ACP methyl ester carboxylesterase